jgi:hypothetical protein
MFAPARIFHESIQAGTPRLHARNSVDVLANNLVPSLRGKVAELNQLILDVLFNSADAAI